MCLEDFTKTLTEATAAEDSAASDYEATTQANKLETTAKEQDVKYHRSRDLTCRPVSADFPP